MVSEAVQETINPSEATFPFLWVVIGKWKPNKFVIGIQFVIYLVETYAKMRQVRNFTHKDPPKALSFIDKEDFKKA